MENRKSRKLISGVNDLATVYPEILKFWDYEKNTVEPHQLSYGTGMVVSWKCSLNHSWKTTPKDIARGRKCPYCTNKKILKGFNDLATQKSELLEFWDFEKNQISPYEVGIGSAKKAWWICSLNHSWFTVIRYVVNGARCPFCSSNKILKGFNDLATKFPDIAKEWDFKKNNNLSPTDFFASSSKTVWWKCQKCDYEWKAPIKNRTSLQQGCPSCAHCSYSVSKVEKDLRNFIQDIFESSLIFNCRQIIKGKELDVYMPDLRIAIEFNGLYWHSEEHKNSSYHYDKWLSCKENNILLLQVWEDDWYHKNEALKNKLTNIVKSHKSNNIYEIKECSEPESIKDFYEKYSLSDFDREDQHLFVSSEAGDIQAVVSYKNIDGVCQISDFISLLSDTSVFSSFVHYIQELQKFKHIEYLDDNCFSDSRILVDSGFSIQESISFSYWIVEKGVRKRYAKCNNFKKSQKIFDSGKTKYYLQLHEQ